MPDNEQMQTFLLELRRGSLTLAGARLPEGTALWLRAVADAAKTRGSILKRTRCIHCCAVWNGQGLLVSDWDTSESRPRKYYSVSEKGQSNLPGIIDGMG